MENPCKVFPGKRSYGSLYKYLKGGVKKWIHTFLNEIEWRSWKSPPEIRKPRQRGKAAWESYTAVEWCHSRSQALHPLSTHCPSLYCSLGATAFVQGWGELHDAPATVPPAEIHHKPNQMASCCALYFLSLIPVWSITKATTGPCRHFCIFPS